MKRILLLIVCSLVILTACTSENSPAKVTTAQPQSQAGDDSSASANDSEGLAEGSIKESVSANLMIDAEISSSDVNSVEVYSGKLQIFEIDNIINLFLGDKEIVSHDKEEPEGTYDFIVAEDNSILSRIDTSFTCQTPYYKNYFSPLINWNYFFETGEIDSHPSTQDLGFATQVEIETQFAKDLDAIGLKQKVSFKTYAFDYHYLSDREEELKATGYYDSIIEGKPKGNWNAADDCYLIVAKFTMGDMGVIDREVRLGEFTSIPPSYVLALYSQNGLESLSVFNPYEIELQQSEKTNIISLEAAKQIAIDKYDSIITDHIFTINKIQLIYVPSQDGKGIKLVPVWLFTVAESYIDTNNGVGEEQKIESSTSLLIDAFSGKEII